MGKEVSKASNISALRIIDTSKRCRKPSLLDLVNSDKPGGQKLNHYLIFATRAAKRKTGDLVNKTLIPLFKLGLDPSKKDRYL